MNACPGGGEPDLTAALALALALSLSLALPLTIWSARRVSIFLRNLAGDTGEMQGRCWGDLGEI